MINQQINTYISDLLCEHNCVVIPEFGGFVANYAPAYIDQNTNYMYAPKKSIVFNRSLQNNDGLLVNEIALCQGLTFKQAKKALDNYVLNLEESLKLHKKVYIEKVGTLLLTAENTLLFVQSDSRNHLLDSFGFGTIQFPKIERQSVQNKIEKKIKQIDKPYIPVTKRPWLKVAAVLLPFLMISALTITNKDRVHDVYANLMPLSTETTHLKPYIPSLSAYEVASPVLNISDALSLFHNSKNDWSSNTIQDTLSEIRFFVVAGAFSNKTNAKRLVSKLKNNGFETAKIIGQNQSGLHRVAYGGYYHTSDAVAALETIRQTTNSSAWILPNK